MSCSLQTDESFDVATVQPLDAHVLQRSVEYRYELSSVQYAFPRKVDGHMRTEGFSAGRIHFECRLSDAVGIHAAESGFKQWLDGAVEDVNPLQHLLATQPSAFIVIEQLPASGPLEFEVLRSVQLQQGGQPLNPHFDQPQPSFLSELVEVVKPFARTAETGETSIARGPALAYGIPLHDADLVEGPQFLVMQGSTHAYDAGSDDGQVGRRKQMFTFPVSYGHTFA